MSKESKAAQGARTREAVLAAIKGGLNTCRDVAEHIGVSTVTVNHAVRRFLDEGVLTRGPRGVLELVGETATTQSLAESLRRVGMDPLAPRAKPAAKVVHTNVLAPGPVVAPVPGHFEALAGMRVHISGLVIEVPSIEQLEAIVARWGSK